jgi:hypothetical protein
VLHDYRAVIARRVDQLAAMTTERFDEIGWSPIGEAPYRDFMAVRVFDMWMHEQDMRRALDRPGHLAGPIVDASLGRFKPAMGYVVGKKAGAPDGSTLVLRATGPTALVWTVAVEGGRARLVAESEADAPTNPTTTIELPFASLVALGGGRWTPGEARAAGGVTVTGDTELAHRVLANLAFTP